MASSTVVKVRKDGLITLSDGAAATYTVAYEDGDFTADTLTGGNAADRIVIKDRGQIVGLRKGDDAVGALSFSVHFREFTNGSASALLDFITGTNAGAALTSTGGSGFEQFLCGVNMTIEGTDHGDTADASVQWTKVLLTASMAEGDPDKLSITGETYVAPTFTGQA